MNTTTRVTDEAAVRALYHQTMEGWNQGSGEAFAAPFSDDASFVAFDGTRFTGRAGLVPFHQRLFDTHLKGTRLVGEVTDVRFLDGPVAVLSAVGGTIPRGRSAPTPERDSVQTLVATRRDGQWRLTAFQNTRLRPMGRTAAGTLLWLVSDWLWKVLRPARSA